MKLIITVLQDNDTEPVSQSLIQAGFRVTRIASTGGFMRRGQSTFMIGVEDDQVTQAIEIIRASVSHATDDTTQGTILFVLPVECYTHV